MFCLKGEDKEKHLTNLKYLYPYNQFIYLARLGNVKSLFVDQLFYEGVTHVSGNVQEVSAVVQ